MKVAFIPKEVNPDAWVSEINELVPAKPSNTESPSIIIEREVVKIPCKYCGDLIDPLRADTCPRCGGKLDIRR